MDSSTNEIIKEIPHMIRVYKDGRYEKLSGTNTVPAGLDPTTGVQSKDVVISTDTQLFVRLYIPKTDKKKVPLLIYFHGGGFIIETAASPFYHNFLNLVSSESNAVIVSVDYRTAPDYPIPTCYHDSWEAIKWVAQHANGNGPDPWLNEYPDYEKVFFSGDSAGANIAHHMAIRVGSEHPGMNLAGVILLHPYFWGIDRVGSEGQHPWMPMMADLWMFAHPETSGLDDPLINPDMDPKVSDYGCSKVLVCVAELDILKDRGYLYKDILHKNGWAGDFEICEDKGVNHVFFLFDPSAEITCTLRKRVCTFINS